LAAGFWEGAGAAEVSVLAGVVVADFVGVFAPVFSGAAVVGGGAVSAVPAGAFFGVTGCCRRQPPNVIATHARMVNAVRTTLLMVISFRNTTPF
jgi:hypothetical protein